MSPNARVVDAFRSALYLDQNPGLRDQLSEMFQHGKATAADQEAIPVLAGRLSFDEEVAIRRTLEAVHAEPSPGLEAYLKKEVAARSAFIAEVGGRAGANHHATMFALAADGIASAIGIGYGLLTGNFDLALSVGMGGSFGAVLATTFGYSRAGTFDAEISGYGVRS